jgi:hypothetical protein
VFSKASRISVREAFCLLYNPLAMTNDSHPDFLGIGAPRAGTTWLWAVLRAHSQIWMPPRKELHYFGRSDKYPSPSHLQQESPLVRLLGLGYPSKKSRKVLGGDIVYLLQGKNKISEVPWLMRYHLGRINDDWYLSLFRGHNGKVKGEITPDYCMLDQEDVEHIHDILPNLKVIYSIRNPVDRSWSHIRFGMGRRGFDIAANNYEQVKRRFQNPAHKMVSDYEGTIRRWRAVYPESQMMIVFQEQIEREPEKLARELYQFLGVDEALPVAENLLRSKVNASAEKEMPAEIRRMMVERYYPEMMELNKLIGGYTEEWIESYKPYL